MSAADGLEEYRLAVEAKYAAMKTAKLPTKQDAEDEIRNRPPDWLLLDPENVIDGVASGRYIMSETEAWHMFFEAKKERVKASRDGWRIVRDTVDHRWFEAFAAAAKTPEPAVWEG